MLNLSEGEKVRNLTKIEKLTDEIKDSIDQLNNIANPKRRLDVILVRPLSHETPEALVDFDEPGTLLLDEDSDRQAAGSRKLLRRAWRALRHLRALRVVEEVKLDVLGEIERCFHADLIAENNKITGHVG